MATPNESSGASIQMGSEMETADFDFPVLETGFVYMLTPIGHIIFAHLNDGKQDKLIITKDGKIESITVNDRNILKSLSLAGKVSYAITDNKNDALKVFKFAAENTTVEWAVDKFKENGKIRYTVGTKHDTGYAPFYGNMGIDIDSASVIASIHSHPRSYRNEDEELSSMGVVKGPPGSNIIQWHPNTDFDLKTESRYYKNVLYYVYMPESGNLWEITGKMTYPIIIKNIKSPKDFPF